MEVIELVEKNLFDVQKFNFVVDASSESMKNVYYKLTLKHKAKELLIGIETGYVGIKPQVALHKNLLLLGTADSFMVYGLDGSLIKKYLAFPVFYEFRIMDDFILVVNELSVFLLDSLFEKKWENNYNEIIDIIEIDGNTITLQFIDGDLMNLDLLTGNTKTL